MGNSDVLHFRYCMNLFFIKFYSGLFEGSSCLAGHEYPVSNVFLAKLQNKFQIIHKLTILWAF